jgi:hypothetical protein
MVVNIEDVVSRAVDELAVSVQVTGPIFTETHVCYVISGLSDTIKQTTNLCWCLLGFVGRIYEMDLKIDSAIGVGVQAQRNLMDALRKRLDVHKELTKAQKERKRDPLLQELIAHALLLIHQSQRKLPEWLGDVQAFRPPHLSVNDSGIDLIAVGVADQGLFPALGEVKAKEKGPLSGFSEACLKFTQVRQGQYNDEIREAVKAMDCGLSKEQLANNIWVSTGRFGAIVGHDREYAFDVEKASAAQEVVAQPSDRLFLISSPYESMREYFDYLIVILKELALQLGEQNGVG